MNEPEVSLVIPTLNEAENLSQLLPQIDAALSGRAYEVLIVDDNSQDATPEVCAELAKQYPVKLLVRREPKDGLGGAVLHGMAQARGKYLLVMDADLQHPPERIPALLEPLVSGAADFSLGSRYVPGGSTSEEWTFLRKVNSYAATMLARPFSGRTLDPMSGFFALTRARYQSAQRLTPLGYKIGLELMCKCRVQNVKEVPIHFATRQRGKSKMNFREQVRYVEHLSRLYDFTFPRSSPISKFLIVLVLSWLVGAAVVKGLLAAGMWAGQAIPISYIAAILVAAVFHRRYIRTQKEFLVRPRPWTDFALIASAELATCALVACWVVQRIREPRLWEMVLLAYGAATVTRYVLRKELLQDLRGLRREFRREELQ